MRPIIFTILIFFPIMAFGVGWDYYVLTDKGQWQQVSPSDLNLAMSPDGGRGDHAAKGASEKQRIMILYNHSEPDQNKRQAQAWIPRIDSDLVKQVEQ